MSAPTRIEVRDKNRVYIAGPMTGHADYNYPAFHEAARVLRGCGLVVVSPAELHGNDFSKTHEEYLAVDLAALDTCGTIFLLPGWEISRGAREELAAALKRDMVVCVADLRIF